MGFTYHAYSHPVPTGGEECKEDQQNIHLRPSFSAGGEKNQQKKVIKMDDDDKMKKNRRPKNGRNWCLRTLFLLLLIAGIGFLGPNASQYLSFGIFDDVLGLKVLTTDDYITLTGNLSKKLKELDEIKAKLASKEQEVQRLAPLQNQVNILTTEKDKANKQLADVQRQVNDLTGQRDKANKQLADVQRQVNDLTGQRDKVNEKLAGVQQQVNELTGQRNKAQEQVTKLVASVEGIKKQLEVATTKNAEKEEDPKREKPAAATA
jgi:septal ring factor EnvC (AmiA/AmiB activator)